MKSFDDIEIDGKRGIAVGITKDYQPVDDLDDADMIKVLFDDGSISFLMVSPET